MDRQPERTAFTLIEVLVVVAILALLVAILLPSLARARENARGVVCQSNLGELHTATTFYLQGFRGVFMPHRYPVNPTYEIAPGNERQWFHLLERYTKSRQLPHCPTLGNDMQIDRNTWQWRYDGDNLGYGYNAFFLGHYLHPDGLTWGSYIAAKDWWKEDRIKNPCDNILMGDSNPKQDGSWSSTLWWPYINLYGEGLNGTRHHQGQRFKYTLASSRRGSGNLVFNDGHTELREVRTINPERDNTDQFIRYWDPLQRPKASRP